MLLSVPGIDIATADQWGTTPLEIALKNGHSEVVSILQEHSRAREAVQTLSDHPVFEFPEDEITFWINATVSGRSRCGAPA